MKQTLISIALLVMGIATAVAHDPQKFSPEKFQADLEQFITHEAALTADEAARFLPLFREMQQKQRTVYDKMKRQAKTKPADDAGCKRLVEKCDACEVELKRIQQTYHNKFFSVLSPSKVYDVIQAENRFHRRAFKTWGQGGKHQKEHQK